MFCAVKIEMLLADHMPWTMFESFHVMFSRWPVGLPGGDYCDKQLCATHRRSPKSGRLYMEQCGKLVENKRLPGTTIKKAVAYYCRCGQNITAVRILLQVWSEYYCRCGQNITAGVVRILLQVWSESRMFLVVSGIQQCSVN